MSMDAVITKFNKKFNIPKQRHKYLNYIRECIDKNILSQYREDEFYTEERVVNKIIRINIKDIIGDIYCEESASIINKNVILKSIEDIKDLIKDIENKPLINGWKQSSFDRYKFYYFGENIENVLYKTIEELVTVVLNMNEDKYDYLYHVTY